MVSSVGRVCDHGMGVNASHSAFFSTTGVGWLWMLELAEGNGDTWCAGERTNATMSLFGFGRRKWRGTGIREKKR
jgi:hypothetical protein